MAATHTLLPQKLITIDEYLLTSYRPDCDFVEGILEERNLGELPHSTLQTELAFWFRLNQKEWAIKPLIEQRIRVSKEDVRICDVCLLHADAPRENVTLTPPLLCLEILSPADRLSRAKNVLRDYLLMGVPNIWLVDPSGRIAYTYTPTGLHQATSDRLEIPGSPVHVVLPDLFAALDPVPQPHG